MRFRAEARNDAEVSNAHTQPLRRHKRKLKVARREDVRFRHERELRIRRQNTDNVLHTESSVTTEPTMFGSA